jgi:hypothetical protein
MNLKRALFVLLATAVLLSGIVAQAPPEPTLGPSQPVREQNLDSSGWIAVHEQGTSDVNVVNGSLDVSGTVSVSNSQPSRTST